MAAETLKYFYFFDISNMTIACLHIVDIWRESILQLTYFSFHLSTFATVKKVNKSNDVEMNQQNNNNHLLDIFGKELLSLIEVIL